MVGIPMRYRVSILPEAEDWWDEKGDLLKGKLKMIGIEPREWWD